MRNDGLRARPRLAPAELFHQWEGQNWKAISIDYEQDFEDWGRLPLFVKEELRTAIVRFFLGELSVTAQTLAPLAAAAPGLEDQLSLTTQLLDETRHSIFFFRYLKVIDSNARDLIEYSRTCWDEAPDSFARFFAQELKSATDRVRLDPADLESWYKAIATYHLVGEGVIATLFLRSTRGLIKTLDSLPSLGKGLDLVARDEARHVAFGLSALRRGTQSFREVIVETVLGLLPIAIRVIVNPERPQVSNIIRAATVARGEKLHQQWNTAKALVLRRLRSIGTPEAIPMASDIWNTEVNESLRQYREIHGKSHPVHLTNRVFP